MPARRKSRSPRRSKSPRSRSSKVLKRRSSGKERRAAVRRSPERRTSPVGRSYKGSPEREYGMINFLTGNKSNNKAALQAGAESHTRRIHVAQQSESFTASETEIITLFSKLSKERMKAVHDKITKVMHAANQPQIPEPIGETWLRKPSMPWKINELRIMPVLHTGQQWGRRMDDALIIQVLGPHGAERLEKWKKYNDDPGRDGRRTEMVYTKCQPDPERVAALYNMHADNWKNTPLRINSIMPIGWEEGCCVCSTAKVTKGAYMDNSRRLNKGYGMLESMPSQLFYTRLPYGKFFFTDQLIDCELVPGQLIYPSALIHVHTNPKWRWAEAGEKRFISCKIWVPKDTPVYFYSHHATGENYAACLFAHTLRVDDMYYTYEPGVITLGRPDSHGVQNVVMTQIEVYDAREVVFHPPETNIKFAEYDLVTPGSFSQNDLRGQNTAQPPDPYYDEQAKAVELT